MRLNRDRTTCFRPKNLLFYTCIISISKRIFMNVFNFHIVKRANIVIQSENLKCAFNIQPWSSPKSENWLTQDFVLKTFKRTYVAKSWRNCLNKKTKKWIEHDFAYIHRYTTTTRTRRRRRTTTTHKACPYFVQQKILDMRSSRERARKSGDSLSTKARGEAPEADRLPGLPGPTVGARARARARAKCWGEASKSG